MASLGPLAIHQLLNRFNCQRSNMYLYEAEQSLELHVTAHICCLHMDAKNILDSTEHNVRSVLLKRKHQGLYH